MAVDGVYAAGSSKDPPPHSLLAKRPDLYPSYVLPLKALVFVTYV